MFGPPGIAYVYFIYGMYHCLNAVTESAGTGGAVLIRALDPEVPGSAPPPGWSRRTLQGPGRLCRQFGIDLSMSGWDLSRSDLRIVQGADMPEEDVVIGPRVGIKRAVDLPLRFRVQA